MADGLHFDEASHTYTLDGRKLPGVTSVLRPITAHEYRGVDIETMERAAQEGRAVHRMIELDVQQNLDEDTLPDWMRPYLTQWRKFVAASGFEPILSETFVCSRRYGYAGTLDLFGRLHDHLALIDAKRTESLPKIAGPQTAGYESALLECNHEIALLDLPIRRYALRITPEHCRLDPLKDPNDRRVFLAALTLHNYMEAA